PASSPSGTRLKTIEMKDASGAIYKRFSLTYDVTTPPHDFNDPAKQRLWLTKVSERPTDMTGSLVYDLAYYQKEQLPGFGQGDGWGYMPAVPNTGLPVLDFNYNKGLLTSITFPTGGVKEFVWE